MKTVRVMLGLAALLGTALALPAQSPNNDLRDPEALYLEGLAGIAPVVLKVREQAPVFATRSLNAHVGNFVPGDEVQLLAHHPDSFLVRSRRGRMEGWVSPKYVESPDPAVIQSLQAAVEEEARFQHSIKKKEVLAGMTFEHVVKALGKPDRKSFRSDENGRFDLWSYVEYRTVVEQRAYRDPATGQIFHQPIRVKVPVGSLEIEFREGRVIALEQTEDTGSSRGTVRLR